ncbi:MAG: hypothetical protein HYR91_05785 [Flavobacteriia bacterium]|nr:hypothetical protein [Flavobacteriia bacterium]
MKFLFISFLLISFMSCKTSKEITPKEETVEVTPSEPLRIVGTIHLQKNGCPILIEANDNGLTKQFYPINLDEKYKVEGAQIRFFYELSRAPQPADCKCEKVVSLYDVTLLR